MRISRPAWLVRRLPSAVLLSICALCFMQDTPALARGEKTVFTSQTLEWDPQFRKDTKARPIGFTPAWTYSGFHAPLMGDLVVSSDRLVAVSREGEIVALASSSGETLWAARLPAAPSSGPSAQGETLFIGLEDARVLALRAADGRVLWEAALSSPALAPPRQVQGRLLVTTADQNLFALDPGNGSILARRALPGRATTAPEPAPGALLIGTEHGMLLALRSEDLAIRWRRYTGHAITAPPLYYKNRVYVCSADRTLRCLRYRSGRVLWTTSTGATSTVRPFAIGPWLYLLSYDNDIYVQRARNGHLMTRVRLGHRLEGDPARTPERLFVAPFTEASLVGLSLPGLATEGTYALEIPGEWFTTSPIAFGPRVAIGYGRTEGRVLVLEVREKPKESAPAGPGAP